MEQPQLALFKQRAEAVQTVVAEVNSMREAFDYAIGLTQEQGWSSVAAPGTGKDFSALKELCERSGLAYLDENLRDHAGAIGTGFTVAEWGIAETATLVLDSTSEDFRIATMLSETHVAVLPESRIAPDAFALDEELSRKFKDAPCYLAFVSGASRTADIERVLTIGVHGPRQLHVLILKDDLS